MKSIRYKNKLNEQQINTNSYALSNGNLRAERTAYNR